MSKDVKEVMEGSEQKGARSRKVYEVKIFPVPFSLEDIKKNITITSNFTTETSKEKLLNQAITLHSQGNISEATKYYQCFINQGFKDYRVFSNYGSILKSLGKLQEAKVSLHKAIELKPDFAESHFNLGNILKDLGKLQEAEKHARKAIEINPNYAKNYYRISKIYTEMKDFDEALKAIDSAITLDPENHIYKGEVTRIRFIKGDLDENLDTNKLLWNDNSDYFFEDNNSNKLLIIFGSNGRRVNKIPSFNFYNLLKEDKTFDKLFLRDIDRNYYINGLKNSTTNLQETIELIQQLSSKKNYRIRLSIGASSGGFAAILYGQLLNFSKVIVFNPQTVISKEKESVVKDFVYTQEISKKLRKINTNDSLYQKCLNLKNFLPFNTKVEIHYSEFSETDKSHATFLKHENCTLIKHATSSHLLALELRDSDKLKAIIKENL